MNKHKFERYDSNLIFGRYYDVRHRCDVEEQLWNSLKWIKGKYLSEELSLVKSKTAVVWSEQAKGGKTKLELVSMLSKKPEKE